MSISPTQLSLDYLRNQGWLVDVCERWIPRGDLPGGGVRRDLFGVLDLIAVKGHMTLGVQTTASSGFNARVNKLSDDEHTDTLAALQRAGWVIEVHGWRKTDKDGHACKHGRTRCGCKWRLHRQITMPTTREEPL